MKSALCLLRSDSLRRWDRMLALFAAVLLVQGCLLDAMQEQALSSPYRTVIFHNNMAQPVTSVTLDDQAVRGLAEFQAVLPGGRRTRTIYGKIVPPLVLRWRDEPGAWHRAEFQAPEHFFRDEEGTIDIWLEADGKLTCKLHEKE